MAHTPKPVRRRKKNIATALRKHGIWQGTQSHTISMDGQTYQLGPIFIRKWEL